jgi:hypothetical protein
MNLDLDDLKDEIRGALDAHGFAIFRGQPSAFEGMSAIFWDTDGDPDYRPYLQVAKQAGVSFVTLAHRQFEEEELDDALAELSDSGLPRNERRDIESGLRGLRKHAGRTCSLEISFTHEGHLYVFQLIAAWFDEFLRLTDILDLSLPPDDEDDDAGPPLSGYFSKN